MSFLRGIDKAVPTWLDIRCIVDNYATHIHPKVKAWLATRPRRLHTERTAQTLFMYQRDSTLDCRPISGVIKDQLPRREPSYPNRQA